MRPVAVMFACAAALSSRAAHASPQDLFGYGARYAAMGATGASFADDYGAVHANPAGISRARARTLTVGYAGTGFDLSVDGAYLRADPGAAVLIGASFPVPFGGALRDRVGLALGFFTPTDVVVRGRIQRAETPQFVVLPDRVQTVAVQFGLGLDLGYGLRAGAGFMAMAALAGSVLVNTDASGRSTSRIDNQLVATYAPVVGLSWERGAWRVGATFRGELVARFRVVISAPDIGVPIPDLNISGVPQYDPAQLQLEGAWQRRGWTVALGLTGKRWSDYPGPSEATTPTSPAPPAPAFSDTLVPRAGVERRWDFPDGESVSVRGGYFFEASPAPAPTAARRYVDSDRHAFTLGANLSTGGAGTRFSFDVWGQYHALVQGHGPSDAVRTWGGSLWHTGVAASVTF